MHVTSVDDVDVGQVPAGTGHRRGGRGAHPRAGARARGQRVAGPDGERAARVSRRRRQDGAHLPGDRRRPLLHPRRPRAAPGQRRDRAARARLGDGELGRREDLRGGGRAGHRRAPRRGRRRRDRPPVGALGLRGGRRRAAGRGRLGRPGVHRRRTPRPTSPATSCPRRSCSWSSIQRSPSGKADYRWAAETAVKQRRRGPSRRRRPGRGWSPPASSCDRSPTWTGPPSPS